MLFDDSMQTYLGSNIVELKRDEILCFSMTVGKLI